jgi:hypothetical protein
MQSIVSTIHMKILCVYLRGRRQFRNNASRIKYSAALNNVDVCVAQENLWITQLRLAFEQKFRPRGMK